VYTQPAGLPLGAFTGYLVDARIFQAQPPLGEATLGLGHSDTYIFPFCLSGGHMHFSWPAPQCECTWLGIYTGFPGQQLEASTHCFLAPLLRVDACVSPSPSPQKSHLPRTHPAPRGLEVLPPEDQSELLLSVVLQPFPSSLHVALAPICFSAWSHELEVPPSQPHDTDVQQ
jgi:hypothetical protein